MRKVETLIIGAGPCGLGAGYRLKELGQDDFLIVEKEPTSGGLASSFRDSQGFLWDIGGHVLFSHYPYFDQALNKALGEEGWYHHQRQAWVWQEKKFIPYPFQNNLHHLDESLAQECLEDLKNLHSKNSTHQNFEQWLQQQFGQKLCEIFMNPYNQKVWGTNLKEMSHQWISERVSLVDVQMIEKNLLDKKDQVSWGPNAQFRFPKKGGTGAIWNAVSKSIGSEKFLFDNQLLSIDPKKKLAVFSDQTIEYHKILSTIPLKALNRCLPEELAQKTKRVDQLTHSTTHIIGLGFKGVLPKFFQQKCWIYFAQKNIPFYRLTVFSNYSPDHVPAHEEHFSLMLEVCQTSLQKQPPVQELIEQCYQALLKEELIGPEHALVSRWNFSAPYGYPVPTLERDQILKEALPELEKYKISSRGRFGGWKYEVSNQDHTFMQGVEWVNKQLLGENESTYTY